MATVQCNINEGVLLGVVNCERTKVLVYYPSNSKKGIAIKGTNLRVGFEYKN